MSLVTYIKVWLLESFISLHLFTHCWLIYYTECEISQLPRSVSDGSPELSENSKNDRVPLRYNIINFHVPGTHRRNMLLRASDNSCFG